MINLSEKLIPVVSIVGPTASGKTELSVNLAKKFNGEIISADSMQIYKEFDIATAKPSASDLKDIKHYLVGNISVSEEFSVSDFVHSASECIKKINNNGYLPFLVGGTGLYLNSLLENIEFESSKSSDENLRNELNKKENEELYGILKKIDPESSSKIHMNNKKRVIRAIEFFYTAGYPISKQVENSRKNPPLYDVCKIGLNFKNRDVLYERINSRVDKMFDMGIIEEVKKVRNMNPGKTASAAIGYKEILDYLDGNISLCQAKENLKQATRRYAKRQLTWFRKDEKINWIYLDELKNHEEIINVSEEILKNFTLKG